MLSEQLLLPMRRVLCAALSVALLGVVGPSMARADEDDDSGDKKEVRVYRMGDEDDNDSSSPQWNEKDDDRDSDRDDDRVKVFMDKNDDDEDSPKVFRYKTERADSKGGYLGVRVQDITTSLRRARDLSTDNGALVNRVENDGPAEEAGIRRGDVIIQVGEEDIDDSSDLIKAMQEIEPGSKVDVIVLRDGSRKTLRVEVTKRPRDMMMTAPGFRWNQKMNPDDMRELRKHIREMNPEKMKMNMPGPEFHQQMEELRREMDDLKRELRDLRDELDESRAQSRGRRSGS